MPPLARSLPQCGQRISLSLFFISCNGVAPNEMPRYGAFVTPRDLKASGYSAWNRVYHAGPWRVLVNPSVGALTRPCHFAKGAPPFTAPKLLSA